MIGLAYEGGLVHSSTAHTENVYTDTGHGILM